MEKSGTLSVLETSSRRNFIFVVLNDFSLIAFANAIEPLRLANRMAGKKLYTWTVSSSNASSEVKCSNYSVIKVTENLPEINREDTIIVCGGTNIRDNTTKHLLSWLRKESRKGVDIGGLCTASYTLAKAGLLSDKKCTIHWENREAFLEEFPGIELSNRVYTIDKNRFCAAGGTASTDLMLSLISVSYTHLTLPTKA